MPAEGLNCGYSIKEYVLEDSTVASPFSRCSKPNYSFKIFHFWRATEEMP